MLSVHRAPWPQPDAALLWPPSERVGAEAIEGLPGLWVAVLIGTLSPARDESPA